MKVVNISLNPKVKEKLGEFKQMKGCTSYSDAVNLLLESNPYYNEKREILRSLEQNNE